MIKHTLTLLALSSIGGSHFLNNANKKNCLCLPRNYVSLPNSMNGADTQRLVVYLYKSPGQQNIRVHIPNAVKQRLLPDFPVEVDDELIDNDQLTLQGIFGNSKVVLINHKSLYNFPGAQMYPGLNGYLNYQISNPFSKGVKIPNRLNFVNQFTPNIPFFGNFLHNYPIQGGINDPGNPNISGDVKITHGSINEPLHHTGKFNVPLNINSEVNSRPNNLVNHGINLINVEGPDPSNPNYSGTINIKHDYPIQGGINDAANPNFSGDIKITHGSIDGPLHQGGTLNVPLNIHSEINSRPNNLINHGIDLINTENPEPINPNQSGMINIKHDYPIQGGIIDLDNPNISGDIKITHGSINGPLHHGGILNVPLNIDSEVNSRPNNVINHGIDLINSESSDPISHNYSGSINIKHDYPIQGGINDAANPNFSGDIKITHGSIDGPLHQGGTLNVPLNIHSEINSRPNNLINHGIDLINTENPEPINPNQSGKINIKHDYPIQGGINDLVDPNFSGEIKITHGSFNGPPQHSGNLNVPLNIHSVVNSRPSHLINPEIHFLNTLNSDPNNPNSSGKVKLTHNFPIAGGITDPDNPNNFGIIKVTHNLPIPGGITDPDNPNYPGNLPHNFPVAGGITDLDHSNNFSKINVLNGSINVPLHNSEQFNVPLNIHSEVNSRPSNLMNSGINFNIPENKITIPGYDWGPYIDSIVDGRELNLPGVFQPGIVNMPDEFPEINIISTETIVNQSIPLNPTKEISIDGSIGINPPIRGELVNLVKVNPELINEPNNSASPGIAIEKILDSDKNQINETTVNGTLNPLYYDGNVNDASITEKKLSGMINISINNITHTENKNSSNNQLEPGGTFNGKVKISSESHSKVVDEPNNTLKPDLEITRTEKNKHSSSPVNSVTKIITHEGNNDNGKEQAPGKIEFDAVSQQINPGKGILSDPINTTYKEINFTIPAGINEFSDLLHSGGVHHKQLGNIPEVAQDTFLNLISDHSRHDNYEFGSFDDWLNHQITTSDSTLNIETIRKLTEKILGENGIRIDKKGVLTDSDGNVFNLTKLKLVPLLIGSPVGYDTIIQNGVIYKNKINLPRNMRYKNSALIAFDDPFRILGIIPLGLSLNTDKRLPLDSKFMKLKKPIDGMTIDRTSYSPPTTIKPVALPDLTEKPESPINYIQNYRGPCANANCFSHRIVPGIEQEKERIYPKTNDANTKIIYLNEPTDERKSILSAINFDQGAGEIIPVVQNMTRLLKKLIADIDSKKAKDVTESPKEPEKPPPDYDEVPGFRIIGGNAATSSGTPVSSKGRSGIIT